MTGRLETLVGGALEKSQTRTGTPRAREELQIALERVRSDADIHEVASRLLRTDRAAPLGERKFVLFGLGRLFETFEARALALTGQVARFVVGRLGDAETLSDSTYCQALCRCCAEVAGVCARCAEDEEPGKSSKAGDTEQIWSLSGGSGFFRPGSAKGSSFLSTSELLGRSWAPGDKEAWFQPTTALALSAGPGRYSARVGQKTQKATLSRSPALDALVGILARASFHADCVTQQNAAEALAAVLRVIQPGQLMDGGLQRLYAAAFAECAKKHDGIGRKYSQ